MGESWERVSPLTIESALQVYDDIRAEFIAKGRIAMPPSDVEPPVASAQVAPRSVSRAELRGYTQDVLRQLDQSA